MSVARFIADQRTFYRVPVAVCCAILVLSVGWFYKWIKAPVSSQLVRRRELDAKVVELFAASERTYGSPRIHRDLLEVGWRIGENTVADSMQRQGLFGRKPKRRKGLTKQDKTAAKLPDLLKRDFTATAPNLKWCRRRDRDPDRRGQALLDIPGSAGELNHAAAEFMMGGIQFGEPIASWCRDDQSGRWTDG